MGKIKAVLIDGGGVLYDPANLRPTIYSVLREDVGLRDLTVEEYKRGFRQFKDRAQTNPDYSIDDAILEFCQTKGKEDVARRLLGERGYIHPDCAPKPPRSVRKLVDEYIERAGWQFLSHLVIQDIIRWDPREYATYFGHVKSVMNSVGYALRDIRNSDAHVVVVSDAYKKSHEFGLDLYALGIVCYVSGVVSSKDVGVKKPHPDIFDRALRTRERFRKDEVVFVSHALDELKGAHEYGIETFAVNYDPADDLSFLDEDHKLEKLDDLARIVEERNA